MLTRALRSGPAGYRGWWVVAALFLSAAATVGTSQYAFGVFVGPLEEAFGWSRTQISASLSFAAVGSLTSPLVGRAMDRYGARPVMALSLSLVAISYLARPLMTELWHWYALSVVQFLGFSGAVALPAGRLVGIWFRRPRGRVMGLTMMGNNFGGLAVPPLMGAVLSITSWQGAYVAAGLLALGVLALTLVAVREFPRQEDGPSGGRVAQEGGNAGDAPVLWGVSVRQALRSRAFYIITAASIMGMLSWTTVLPQAIAHFRSLGYPLPTASLALSALAAFGMAGKLVFGYLAERMTARRALMVSMGGQALFLVLLVYARGPLLWAVAPLYGLFMGGFGALFQLLIQDTFGIRYFGSITGLINLVAVVAFAGGPLLAGLSFDLSGSYGPAFLAVSALYLVAVALLTTLPPTREARG